ncbi:MAG: HAMP domain-containing protein [Bacteroidetes bacterium]|nr:HAMP domain-containing protein [Bacteroidota bacterium]
MNIKTKLTLGVGLLFILIIILSLTGAFNIQALKSDSENILTANYKSLQYCTNMLAAMEERPENYLLVMENNLRNQERNITEEREAEVTGDLRTYFDNYKSGAKEQHTSDGLRQSILKIMDMNMNAIEIKSDIAKATADKAVFWIMVSGSLCFIIAFFLLVRLPATIAGPIKELTSSIKQIAAGNYSQRVNFEGHNEFGQLAASFNIMASKLEEYNNSNLARLMKEKLRIETLINRMHDPVVGLDENLKIIFANEEAIKVIGISGADLVGKFAQEIAVRNDLVRTLIQDIMLGVNPSGQKQNTIKINSDKKECYFEKEIFPIVITPEGEKESRMIGHVIFLRNVTSYKELDFARTNFIATISHEFKTPISSIKLSLQIIENEKIGKLNSEQRNLIDSIKDDANRLLKITGELLNMSQVESGNIHLTILPSDPKEMLMYSINATKSQADQKQIKFDIDCPENIAQVLADNEKTAWVITNLISNAIRYSYDNSTVLLRISESATKVSISVKDTGQGIAPEYKSKIFDRYFRVPGTKKEGTGLGLSISKEFMEAQGGTIQVESDFGAGSTFTIVLNKLNS